MTVDHGGDPVPLNGNKSDLGRQSGGEIDIIEGVDGEGANLASLHTGGACQVPSNVSTVQQGSLQQPNCTNQPGCATKFDNVASFGLGFNANLDSKSLPVEVVAPLNNAPTTLNYEDAINAWGKPQAFFGSDFGNGSDCSMSENFNNHEIIFDTTTTCQDFIINNGSQLDGARWEIDYLRIYSNGCEKQTDKPCPKGQPEGDCSHCPEGSDCHKASAGVRLSAPVTGTLTFALTSMIAAYLFVELLNCM
ncbi:uncharacterized protein MJAP1_001449 [Malassezia japonica]|uniref:Uncharacterized protein n=1 Tax=Malassezia japonica TaxID=223818 RepID=A0AAF0EWW0_9BASI|nr:uncharacterized protein MJAP1_001449 [Malassezia japonica]WFD38496.1 hypothetical protein MJAP1_001449 [Malassezia japonica]